jgi:hypothetical protein
VATYRVLSLDTRTNALIAELPISGLSYSSVLNGVGELSGTVILPASNTDHDRFVSSVYNDAVDEVRRQLVVERDGVIVWCGIVWASPYEDDKQSRSVRAAETWSYFRRRVITSRYNYTDADQLTIAKDLITGAQAASGGNINVTTPTTTSGVLRTQKYEAWEYKPVGEAVEKLAEMQGGFDFAIDAAWSSAGALTKTLTLSYPRRGRSAENTGHVFEVGRNVISWDWPTDGTRYANKIYNVGAGEAENTLRVSASDASQLTALAAGGPGYPLIEKVITNTDTTTTALLTAQANNELLMSAREVVLPSITVRADMDPVFGSYITGDSCRFICQADLSPRFPDGIDTYRRIIGWSVNVNENGGEEVQLTLGNDTSA